MLDAANLPQNHPAPASVSYGPLLETQLARTASLHQQHLGTGLFLQLGKTFVRRWHRTFIENPHACGFTAVGADGEILGFILGSMNQHEYVRHTLLTDRWPLMARGAAALAVRPHVAAVFARTRLRRYLRRFRGTSRPVSETEGPTGVVHAIVTAPEGRGQGIGRHLLKLCEAETAGYGTYRIQLLTDVGPDGAAGFYRALGWQEGAHVSNRDGRAMIAFSKAIRE